MKRFAPATERNREPLLAVLKQELPKTGLLLEVAAGSGEHAVFLAPHFPQLQWQPSDPDAEALASIAAWREDAGSANLLAPLALDASAATWPIERADAMLCVNMVHISPWQASEGLFAAAGRMLPAGAPLVLYGPFIEDGVETAPSNLAFDESLRSRDPRWGIRSVSALDDLAAVHGLTRMARHQMPANNLTLVWRKA
ncbi:MAG: DUF938 domain-containing protein [Sphingomonadaceae bacterium]|nr:DUF938 domain-containing protein [Sphingomonadaceae bacterium]